MPVSAKIKNVRFIDIPRISESHRGSLCVAEIKKQIPFAIKRIFYIFDVPKGKARGEHANKKTEQVLICLGGRVEVEINDGFNKEKVVLSEPQTGLFLDKMLWRKITFLEKDTILLVLASELYDGNDYIRDEQDFRAYFQGKLNDFIQ